LMKYLYKGMAMPGWGDISGSVLLGWHEKVRIISNTDDHDLMFFFAVDRSRRDGLYRTNYDRPENCIILGGMNHRTLEQG
jgi:hypothetical protein